MEMSCPPPAAPLTMLRSNIFQIPNTMFEQEVTLTWPSVWGQLQVEASGQVQWEQRVSQNCINSSTCMETRRGVRKQHKQTKLLIMMMMINLMMRKR